MPLSRWSNRTGSSWLSALLVIASLANDNTESTLVLVVVPVQGFSIPASSLRTTYFSRATRKDPAVTVVTTRSAKSLVQVRGSASPGDDRSEPQRDANNSYSHSHSQNSGEIPDTAYNRFFREFVQWLAELSLEDYQWRSNLFRSNQADRMLEESLARMRGENATYVRPMDAPVTGPLGRWEQRSVEWLFRVVDEEGRRAQKIVANAGNLIRPSDNKDDDDEERLGPLGFLEQQVVEFFAKIRRAERERVRTKTLRPKDLEEALRGPLGQLEWEAVRTWDEIRESESLRAQQIRLRGGEIVRPIDVPGPLGELELKVAELFQAEQRRARERERNQGRIVRPKDASLPGPLGQAESTAYDTIQSLSQEEMQRLRNLRQVLQERRPMDNDRESLVGAAEAFLVGILRGPQMVARVFQRVLELLQSQTLLNESDKEMIKKRQEIAAEPVQPSEKNGDGDNDANDYGDLRGS